MKPLSRKKLAEYWRNRLKLTRKESLNLIDFLNEDNASMFAALTHTEINVGVYDSTPYLRFRNETENWWVYKNYFAFDENEQNLYEIKKGSIEETANVYFNNLISNSILLGIHDFSKAESNNFYFLSKIRHLLLPHQNDIF